jgi:hypothetical protein
MEFCHRYADRLGFEPDKVMEVIEFMTESIKQGHDKNTICAGLEKFLKK